MTLFLFTFNREDEPMSPRTLSVMLILAVLAACAHAGPRPGTAGGAGAPAQVPSPFAALGERESLELSSAQVEAIDSIARSWAATDERLRALPSAPILPEGVLRLVWGGQRRNHVARALNDRRAVDALAEVLTREQRDALCRSGAAEERTALRAGRGPETVRSPRRQIRRAEWPWCTQGSRASSLAQRGSGGRPDRGSR